MLDSVFEHDFDGNGYFKTMDKDFNSQQDFKSLLNKDPREFDQAILPEVAKKPKTHKKKGGKKHKKHKSKKISEETKKISVVQVDPVAKKGENAPIDKVVDDKAEKKEKKKPTLEEKRIAEDDEKFGAWVKDGLTNRNTRAQQSLS